MRVHRLVLTAALVVCIASAPSCSKSSGKKAADEAADKSASSEPAGAGDQPTAEAAKSPDAGHEIDRREERERRAAAAREARAGAAPERAAAEDRNLPPVMSVDEHKKRADRQITTDNYKSMLDELEKEIQSDDAER